MAKKNQPVQKGIKQSWSLVSFVNGRRLQVGEFTNSEDGSHFKSCIVTDEKGDREFIAFSSNMGELTPKQISQQKAELQVVELESGSFILCRQGDNSWEDVKL